MRSKIKVISFLQFFAIILVVLGHSGLQHVPELNFFFNLIYSFHMPLYFVISGFLLQLGLNKYKENRYITFVKNKFIYLLLPYFVISTITFFPKIYLSEYALRPVSLSWDSYITGILYPFRNPIIFFWFLPTIFFLLCMFFFFSRYYDNRNGIVNVVVFGILLLINIFFPNDISLLNISAVLFYSIFFYFGMILCVLNIKFNIFDNRKIFNFPYIILFFSLLIISNLFLSYDYVIVTNFLGIIFSFQLAVKLKNIENVFVRLISKYSYQIYLFSWFGHQAVILLFKILKINNGYASIIFSFTSGLFLSLLFGIFADKFVKNTFLRSIVGLKKK